MEKVYLRHDFSGFKGDRKFIRDDQAQKAFSKLRSSIAGVYAWRINDPDNRGPGRPAAHDQGGGFRLPAGVRVLPLQPGSGVPLREPPAQPAAD